MKRSPNHRSKKNNSSAAAPAAAAVTKRQAPSAPKPTEASFPIVGVGASAGALEAYSHLLKALPAEPGMAFVFVPHLDPTHESALPELLSHTTKMPVLQIEDGTRIIADHVYVLPPNCEVKVSQGVLRLKAREPSRTPHMVVDIFLRSLAEDQGSNAVGVILSGTASDGTLGVMAVKGEGGITFAQDSASARYDGMPSSAVASGCIDFILPPNRIAEELLRIRQHPYVTQPKEVEIETLGEEPSTQLVRVFRLLRETSGVDFSEYKPGTIRRRILRRMALKHFTELGEYTRYLLQHRDEVHALYQDLLINVTSFFRNPEAFAALKEVVYPSLLKERTPGETIRIWVPGCSTGEEAYSHAISLMEYLGEMRSDFSIQVFGTDLSAEAIYKARAGIYKESIRSDVSSTRLRRFFTPVEGGYQINKAIRNVCVFAVQNVFKDAPFSRMDIVSCRNVLIYMSQALQKRIIPILHYSLKANGFLMVGNTEGLLGVGHELFELIDKKHKFYHKRQVPSPVQFGFAVDYQEPRARKPEVPAILPREAEALKAPLELQREADRLLLARYVPAAVVVNDHMEILQTRGHTHRYLELPPGKATLNLLKMARQGLMFELQSAIKEARNRGLAVRKENLQLENHSRVNIEITPFKAPLNETQNFLVIFEDTEAPVTGGRKRARLQRATKPLTQDEKERQIEQFKRELSATKEYLQSIIESQEASNEELQSANEEIQSGNEELQSTNEELQTSKEELESANEELSTVNEEMQHRNLQLTQTTNDLTNFLASVNIPMVMLGADRGVRRFTPQAENVLGLTANDVGRPITNLRLKIDVPELEALLVSVIEEVKATHQEIQDSNGIWRRLRITPYRTPDNRIEGAVLVLLDINDLKRSNEELALERANLEQVLRQMPSGLVIVEAPSGKVLRVNARLQEIVGRTLSPGDNIADYLGYALRSDGKPQSEQWAIMRSMSGEAVRDEEIEWVRADGRHVFVSVSSTPIRTKEGEIIAVVASFFDLTFRHSAEEMLRVSEQISATGRLAAALAHEINNPLEILTNAIYLMGDDQTLGEKARKYQRMAEAELKRIAHISSSLLGLYRGRAVSERFYVHEVLDEVLGLLEAKIELKKIQVAKRYDFDGEMIGSATEVQQIFLNLVRNALEALGSNGKLFLRISASRNWRDNGARGVRVTVTDNGPGISRENRPRIFEPFFSTKGERGTGLGLWVSRGLATKCGGSIRFRSCTDPGKHGTCFTVFLPSRVVRRRSRAQAGEAAAAAGSGQEGGEAEA